MIVGFFVQKPVARERLYPDEPSDVFSRFKENTTERNAWKKRDSDTIII